MTLTRVLFGRFGALVALCLVLAACGEGEEAGGETVADDAGGGVETGEDLATDAPASNEDQEDGAQEAPATDGLTAADGWGDLHDFDLPAPGTAELTIEGETLVAEVECLGPGEVPDHFEDTGVPLNEFILYQFIMQGRGELGDEGQHRLTVERTIYIAGDRYNQIENMGWGGGGQMDMVHLSAGGDIGVSWQLTPSSSDPTGSLLPLVRVTPDGGVTAEGELSHEFEGDATPEGAYTLVGQCQEGWPEDVLTSR